MIKKKTAPRRMNRGMRPPRFKRIIPVFVSLALERIDTL
jgi:hypothetical protein